MKKSLPTICARGFRMVIILMLIFLRQFFFVQPAKAQIYEPEGLNMPGSWNAWTNPPSNLALASSTQVPGGRVIKIAVGTTRWQTSFSVAATGGDLIGGTYDWLFTSGPSTNYFQNKWANIVVAMNSLQTYTTGGSTNNNITLVNGKWYTMNWEDKGYFDTRAIFMETSAQPVSFTSVSVPVAVLANEPATISVVTSLTKCAEEIIYLRYTTDAWATSVALPVTMSGNTGTIEIPAQTEGTVVEYYAFSSTLASLSSDFDLCTINLMNNGGLNYSYTVAPPPPSVTWANLQFPESGAIETGQLFEVFGQALIPGITGQVTAAPGLQMWVGYSTTNTNPDTWTNWIPGTFNTAVGNNDEFKAEIGTSITVAGTYYYATRFQLNADPYVYGGYNGGFWDGTTNISGTLTVNDPVPVPDFDWVNLQFPGSGTILPEQEFLVFAQAYIPGVTGQVTPAAGVQSWIGYSTTNSDPATWTNWVPAPYNSPVGNNDEFKSDIGAQISTPGTYYYASRFQLNTGDYYYGGFSETGGGFWDGTANISGVLTVSPPPVAYPVLFTIFDGTLNNTNIKFKGQMTAWDTISMIQNNNMWTLTLNLFPGTYEWGAIEDDGSPSGIWLIAGDNLVVTVDDLGNVSGTITYTTLITGIEECIAPLRIYPNPTSGILYFEMQQQATISITDMQGKLMFQKESLTGGEQIDLTDYKAGVYNVEIRSGKNVFRKTIIRK